MASKWRQLVLKHLDYFFGCSDSLVCLVNISYMAKGNKIADVFMWSISCPILIKISFV